MSPKVSIIIATHNGGRYLGEAIESVIGQTFSDWELIIVNDASTDKTQNIIEEYEKRDSRIHGLKNKVNLERSASRNRGIGLAQGEYVAFLDDDDIWFPIKLEKQINYLEYNLDCVLCGTSIQYITADGTPIDINIPLLHDIDLRKIILMYNPFALSSLVCRKSAIEKTNGFSSSINMAEDYEFILGLGLHGKIANISDILLQYRIVGNSSRKRQFLLRYNCIKACIRYRDRYPNFSVSIVHWLITFIIPYHIAHPLGSWLGKVYRRFL